MIIVVSESEYQRQRRRAARIKRALIVVFIGIPLAALMFSGIAAVCYWWSH